MADNGSKEIEEINRPRYKTLHHKHFQSYEKDDTRTAALKKNRHVTTKGLPHHLSAKAQLSTQEDVAAYFCPAYFALEIYSARQLIIRHRQAAQPH